MLSIVVCIVTAAGADGVPLEGVPLGSSHLNVESTDFVGTGEETTYLVVDFRAAGGGSFAFGYRHGGMDTALDMLESFAAAGVLEVAYEEFGFGPAVRGIGYLREQQADVFTTAFGGERSWILWDGAYVAERVEWTDAQVGINGIVNIDDTEPSVFLPPGGFVGFSTWDDDQHPFPGPPPLAPLPGDFDSDGIVDGHDLLGALLGFGTATGPTLAAGDADRDGDVDRADISLWRENVGASLFMASGAVQASSGGGGDAYGLPVPEPSSLVLLLSMLAAVAMRVRA